MSNSLNISWGSGNGSFADDDDLPFQFDVNSTEALSSLLPCSTDNETLIIFEGDGPNILTKIHNSGLVIIILLFMLAMGCDMKVSQIKSHIRNPKGIIIGMVCQFGIMPFYGFGLIQLLGVHGFFGTGILLVSCCPGGSISNILTYLFNGEIALSVTMTTMSTTIALAMMPFNMWLYGHLIETTEIVIPYAGITFSLLLITTPVAIGMLIRWKIPKLAPYVTKIGGTVGFFILMGLAIMEIALYYRLYMMAPWPLYVSCFCLMPMGYFTGYIIMWIFKEDFKACRTVGIECGVQNAAMATTIASLSFAHPGQLQVRLFPVVYSIAQAIVGFMSAGLYRILAPTNDSDLQLPEDVQKIKQVQYLSERECNPSKVEEAVPLAIA